RLRGGLEQPPGPAAEVDDVEAPLLRRVRDAVRQVQSLVQDRRALGSGVDAHRGHDRALRPRGDDRLRDTLDPHARPRAAAAQPRPERSERVDLVGADVLAEAEEDHAGRAVGHAAIMAGQAAASAARSASATRSWSSRSSRVWNGIAIVRAEQSSLTGN